MRLFDKLVVWGVVLLLAQLSVSGADENKGPYSTCEDAWDHNTTDFPCGGNGFVLGGNTINATATNKTATCDGNSASSPGKWYMYLGNHDECFQFYDNPIVLAEVTNCYPRPQQDFDATFTVYSGSCNDLACVDVIRTDGETGYFPRQDGSENNYKCSTISWYAENKKRYYIHVHGFEGHEKGNFRGQVAYKNLDGDEVSSALAATSIGVSNILLSLSAICLVLLV